MALFLKDADVQRILTMDAMLEAIEAMLHSFGAGRASNLARRKITAPDAELAVMAGGLFYDGVFGVKTYTGVNGRYFFHVSLYDATTGQLLAYLQANRLGQLRTGATTGVAVKYLAREQAPMVGVIGTGYQAPAQLEGICRVRPVARVKAYSRSPERRRAFAQAMASLLGIEVVAANTNQEAVEGSDVVVCIAANETPVVCGSWLAPGMLVVGAGPVTLQARELDEAAVKRADRIVVDSLEQAPQEAGDLASAVDKGLIQWSQVTELRHVVGGQSPGRRHPEEMIYAKLMGTGVADVAAAKLAYDTARKRGVGLEMDF